MDTDERTPLLREEESSNSNPNNDTTIYHDTDEDHPADSTTAPRTQVTTKQHPMRARLKFIFPFLATGIFLSAADQTIVVSSYGRIGSDLSGLEKAPWLATAYLITNTAFQPLYGKLSDVVGRKPCLLFAYAAFGLGAFLCGVAGDMTQLIAARAVAGVGAGGMTTVVTVLLSDVVTLEERGLWQGYVNMVFACGAGLGAPLGGVFADTLGWRWGFLLQSPLCAVAGLVAALAFREVPPLHVPNPEAASSSASPDTGSDDGNINGNNNSNGTSTDGNNIKPKTKTTNILQKIDLPGSILLITFLTSLLLLLDNLTTTTTNNPTNSLLYLYITITLTTLPLLFYIESKSTHPLIPTRLLLHRSLLPSNLANAFTIAAWFGVMFYLPLLYQAVSHLSPSQSGALLLPGIISAVVGGILGGGFLKRHGGNRFVRLGVGSYAAVGVGALGVLLSSLFVSSSSSYLSSLSLSTTEEGRGIAGAIGISLALFLGGMGNGSGMTASLVSVVAHAEPRDQAGVTALSFLFRSLGTAVGLAVLAGVFRWALAFELARRMEGIVDGDIDVGEVLRRVQSSLGYIDELPPAERAAARAAYGVACRWVFGVSVSFAVVGAVSMSFVRERRKN